MNKSIELFKSGHVSSCGTTTQWNRFYSTFKSEFRKELKKIGAQEIVFSKGHFYLSGFFTHKEKNWIGYQWKLLSYCVIIFRWRFLPASAWFL